MSDEYNGTVWSNINNGRKVTAVKIADADPVMLVIYEHPENTRSIVLGEDFFLKMYVKVGNPDHPTTGETWTLSDRLVKILDVTPREYVVYSWDGEPKIMTMGSFLFNAVPGDQVRAIPPPMGGVQTHRFFPLVGSGDGERVLAEHGREEFVLGDHGYVRVPLDWSKAERWTV